MIASGLLMSIQARQSSGVGGPCSEAAPEVNAMYEHQALCDLCQITLDDIEDIKHSTRNRNENRVIAMLAEALDHYPDFRPTRIDVEDIYALTLNKLPPRYVQKITFILNEPVSDELIREKIHEAVAIVRTRPH